MPFIPLNGFTPSVDPTTPGAILDCTNVIPTLRGMKSAPSKTPFGNPAFPSQVRGMANCTLLSGIQRSFAGTSLDLYEIVDTANVNVSNVAGGYAGGTNPWRFAQFGNASLASNGQDQIQQSIAAGAFAPIGNLRAITLGSGGTGYTSAPPITISGVPGATAHATVASGAVTSIVVDNPGAGAIIGQPVTITIGGPGTGATATAVMNYAPAAAIIEVVQGFVFAFNTIDGPNGQRTNGWACSGLYDQTQWTPDQATQCANGIIIDQPGPMTAGRAFGTNIIAFKARSMFYGVYQGPPVIWAFNQISPQIGTPCQEAVISTGNSLLFLGTDAQVYEFDGNIPLPIGDVVHEWLGNNWSNTFQDHVQSYHDQQNSTVYWYFCSVTNSTGIPDMSLVYNYRVGKFGRADQIVEAAAQVVSGQITWEDMGSLPGVTTWQTLPQIQYNSSYWAQSAPLPAIVDNSHTLNSLNGVSQNSSITTGFLGDDSAYSHLASILPRFTQMPATCTGSANAFSSLGAPNSIQWPMGDLYDGEMAGDFSTRWTQLVLNFTGNHEIIGFSPNVDPAGAI